jgi:hypothetical protein
VTEAEWLWCEEPKPMLMVLSQRTSGRKGSLLGCACCRRNWKYLRDMRCTAAIETIERAVDGLASVEEIERVSTGAAAAHDLIWSDASEQRWWYVGERAAGAVLALCETPLNEQSLLRVLALSHDSFVFASEDSRALAQVKEWRAQCRFICDIFGNPFRPIVFSPSWRTDTAVALAKQMYESREFSAMPILADALQDAGCNNEEVLNHCRDPKQTHVRGCWVVDLVLGKQ